MTRTLEVALGRDARKALATAEKVTGMVDHHQLRALGSVAKTLAGVRPAPRSSEGGVPSLAKVPELRPVFPAIASAAFKMPELKPVFPAIAPAAFKVPELKPMLPAIASAAFKMPELKPMLPAIAPVAFRVSEFKSVLLQFEQTASELECTLLGLRACPDPVGAASAQLVLEDLEIHADSLGDDYRQDYKDAGAFLRKAVRGYREALASEDSYMFADVIRWAVGALEEVACQLTGMKATRLGPALRQLKKDGLVSPEDQVWLEEVYVLRSRSRGIGHGAGGAPEYAATFALSRVEEGLRILLPREWPPSRP